MDRIVDIMQVAAVIGDVVGSRQVPDRAALQTGLGNLLDGVGRSGATHLGMTIGDEFQGRFASLSDAVSASLDLHLGSAGLARLRIGIGWGDLAIDSGHETQFGQDGPAWWRARDAIERLEEMSGPARTLMATATKWDDMLNQYLTLRDNLLDDLDETDAAIARGILAGRTQRDMAGELRLHESSVSRRVNGHRINVLVGVARPSIPGFGTEP